MAQPRTATWIIVFKQRFLHNRRVVFLARCILGVVFLTSSLGKFVDIPHYSIAMVYDFDILPGPLAIGFGWALPFIEFLCGIGLLFGILTRLSAVGIGLLSISFFIAKAVLLSRGIDMACGCFGAIGSTMVSWSIILDPAILVLSLLIVFSASSSRDWMSMSNKLLPRYRKKMELFW